MDTEVIIALLTGAGVSALIGVAGNIIIWKMNRKAKLEDEDNELNKTLKNLTESNALLVSKVSELDEAYKDMLKLSKKCFRISFSTQIRDIGTKALRDGEISLSQKETIHELHSAYHNDCDGNGFFDELMKDIDDLTVR